MRIRKLFVASCLAAGATLAAAHAAAQGFFGGSVGQSDIDGSITRGLIDSGTVDGKDTGWKIFGGAMVSPYFGLEFAYVDLGDVAYSGTFRGFTVSDGKVRVSGVNFAFLGSYAVIGRLSVLGKIGLFLSEAKFGDTIGGVPSSGSDEETDLSFGLGLGYDFTRHLGVRAEWERFKLGNGDSADLISAGMLWRF